ncbi:solute carrier family 35 member B1 homolog [Nilaparvata lugens]|uniref:solute carrier family 35 member B1 homolog n=1 Tax=Nilaparvata lugens TaxID=108931 RepID=UPI000B980E0E|nr:solute carrier family 35 member B1 homolog [Nilaparvata lugens]
MDVKRNVKLVLYSVGIFVCYSYYAIVQERITRGKYVIKPGEEEHFTYMLSLVCAQCIVNYVYAVILSKTIMPQGENVTNWFYLASSALTYLLAMVCTNMALKWVNYPTQVIGKSAKPIPVMILGVLLGNKSYPAQKYFFVLLVVLGVALFMFKDGKQSKDSESGFGFGEVLLGLSLIMDGLTGAIQERMRAEYKTKSLHMMSSMNKWSVIFLGVCIIYTGELMEFISFVSRHQSVIWELITFSIASAQGQMFIFLMIEHFGPLPCSIVTTTRKLFTVLFSILLFGNVITSRQWLATFIVFSGLFLDTLYGKAHRSRVD